MYGSKLTGKIPELIDFLKRETNYDINMIWQNLLRTQSMRTLVKTMRLYHIESYTDVYLGSEKVALCIDVTDTDALSQIMMRLHSIVANIDLYIYYFGTECRSVAETCFSEWEGTVSYVEKTYDLNALWQENSALLQYDAVGFISTDHVASDITDSFRLYDIEHFDNMFDRLDCLSAPVKQFKQNERLGMLVSGVRRNEIHFFWAWHYFRSQFFEFCKNEGIIVPFNDSEVPPFYNTDFCWVRSSILPLLWKHTSAVSQSGLDVGFRRCFAMAVFQSAGYYTMYTLSRKAAEDSLNLDDHCENVWLSKDFQQRNNSSGVKLVVPDSSGLPMWKRVLNRFPRLKACLKWLYLKFKHLVADIKTHRSLDTTKIDSLGESCATVSTAVSNEAVTELIDVRWAHEVFDKDVSKVVDPEHLDIAFLVPKPIKGGGGHRNIYRAVRFLSEYGHQVTVYHADCQDELGSVTKQHVCEWFYPLKEDVRFISYSGKIGPCDVCIACWWELSYELRKNISYVKYPFYLVQDYEAAFYPMSASALMAENSYKMGFSHICSGRWCKEFLEKKYNAEAAYFTFPVNHQIYNMDQPRTKRNKNIVFFAKPEMPRRCYELGIRALAIVKEQRPDIEIILYGSNNVTWIPCEVTLKGVLPTINDLAQLYRNATLGMVFSTTNPSLVPYEMMLCGCPVVDVNMEQAIMKYGNDENNVFLFDTEPERMASQILGIIDDEDLLCKKALSGRNWVKRTFPTEEEMGRIVEGFIKNKVKTGRMLLSSQD